MANIFIALFMFVLLVTCGLMTVIILMQKPSANAGMGAALGGGAAESVFGGETATVLLKYTVRIAVAFFLLSFFLYMGFLVRDRSAVSTGATLPDFGIKPTAPAPASATTAAGVTSKTTVSTSSDTSKPAPGVPAAPAASTTPAPAASTAK